MGTTGGSAHNMGEPLEGLSHPTRIYFLPAVHHRPLRQSEVSVSVSVSVGLSVGDDEEDRRDKNNDDDDNADDNDDPVDALVVCASWQVRCRCDCRLMMTQCSSPQSLDLPTQHTLIKTHFPLDLT